MIEDLPKRGNENQCVDLSRPFDGQTSLLEWLYAQSQAGRWEISRERFAAVLERSAKKALSAGTVTLQKLQEYLSALHLEDLALTTACADGNESAWEHFFATYRPYLRSAAAAILRCSAGSAEACDLADSLFSELYGLADGKGSERSLFRYFHGRSTLKLEGCSESTNLAFRGIWIACAVICARPSKTFFAKVLARRMVPRFNLVLAMRKSLSVSNTARGKPPSIWTNCCPAQNPRALRPESRRRDRQTRNQLQESGNGPF